MKGGGVYFVTEISIVQDTGEGSWGGGGGGYFVTVRSILFKIG